MASGTPDRQLRLDVSSLRPAQSAMADKIAEPIRVGVAGCGWISTHIHLPNLRRMSGVRVTAVADVDRDARTRSARIVPDAVIMSDWRDMIDRDDIDAIVIALPTAFHADAAESAIRAGRHVYIEKPLATSLGEATRVRNTAEASRAIVMLGFNYRFNPLYRSLRDAIIGGRIGDLLAVRSVFSTNTTPGGWRSGTGHGAGVLLDLASHHVDLIRFVTRRDVSSVTATIRDVRSPADTAALQCELAGGATAQCYFTMAGAEADTMEITGTTGTARVSRYESLAIQLRRHDAASGRAAQLRDLGRSARNLPYLWHKRSAPGHEPSWSIALSTFIRAVRGETTDHPGLEDGLYAMAVIEAAATSAVTGCAQAVHVDSMPSALPGETSPE